jgi:hypothetical protein
MTDSEPTSISAAVRLLLAYWAEKMREEWHARTRYGKLLYPGWVVLSAIMWLQLAAVFAVGTYFCAVMRALDGASAPSVPKPSLPNKYKHDQ